MCFGPMKMLWDKFKDQILKIAKFWRDGSKVMIERKIKIN
jgi:hypothetical protein